MFAVRRLSFVALATASAACASGRGMALAPDPRASACVHYAETDTPAESIVVSIGPTQSLSMSSATEDAAIRFVRTQLYETLVGVDCEGHVTPMLAQSWIPEADGRTTIRLRDGARFWSGAPVTAQDVVAAWEQTAVGADGAGGAARARSVSSTTRVVDDAALTIASDQMAYLADSALIIARSGPDSRWPEGTGRFRLASDMDLRASTIELKPVVGDRALPRVVLRLDSGDARDRLDAGDDVVITHDPLALSYATSRSDFSVTALPWGRTYALALPHRHDAPDSGRSSGTRSDTLRASLARDVVRADARAAAPVVWSYVDARCGDRVYSGALAAESESRTPVARVVYRADDPIARSLAERLVALGRMSDASAESPLRQLAPELASNARLTAVGMAPSAFALAVTHPIVDAFIVSMPVRSAAPCADVQGISGMARPLLQATIVPLVETRDHVIARRDRASFAIDLDGVVRILPSHRPSTAARP